MYVCVILRTQLRYLFVMNTSQMALRESFLCYLKGNVAFGDFSDANLAKLMWFQEAHSDALSCTDVVCCGIRRELDIVLGSWLITSGIDRCYFEILFWLETR